MESSWDSLATDTRCQILRRLPPQARIIFWMTHDAMWTGLFGEDKKENPQYIARIWTVRDDAFEARMLAICGVHAMNEAAALLGYRDWLEAHWTHASCEQDTVNIAYWLAIGGHTDLLCDFIATGLAGASLHLIKTLWTAAAIQDNPAVFTKLIEWHLVPVYGHDGAEFAATYRILGEHAAEEIVRHYVRMVDTEYAADETAVVGYDVVWLRAILLGTMTAPESKLMEAHGIFIQLTRWNSLPDDLVYELLEAAIVSETPDRIWYVRFWLEEMSGCNVDHSCLLSYAARRAIELNDIVLLNYIVGGVAWGDWTLAEPILWTACEAGTAANVAYLLEHEVPRSSRAYYHANGREDIIATLMEFDVPLEDIFGSALLCAVEVRLPISIIARYIDEGCPVTLRVLAMAGDRPVFDLLMSHVPADRHAEYKDYVFYDALACDNAERVLDLIDNFDWPIPLNFYYRCCMLNATRTFTAAWSAKRFFDSGVGLIEDGIAHNVTLVEFVWRNQHDAELKLDWARVIATATEEEQDEVLSVLYRYMSDI